MMRFVPVFVVILSGLCATSSSAQGWRAFMSLEDGFRVRVPGEFAVTETTWDSEYGAVMPARIYLYEDGASSYKLTVVDYTDAYRIHAEREDRTEADTLRVYWEVDVRASVVYAASMIRSRPGSIAYNAYHYIGRVPGEQIQMIYPDESRLYAAIYLHAGRLYVLEATVPPNTPPPVVYQQSLAWVDENGNDVSYRNIGDAPTVVNKPDGR
ncbi:MAG: hypothetical protein ACR2QQ_12150 [Gammaproteobacteria bacterium]